MACGIAVKRNLELDPHHSPDSVKRPRSSCSPMRLSPPLAAGMSPLPVGHSGPTAGFMSSAFNQVSLAYTPEQVDNYIQSEIRRLRRRKVLPRYQPYRFGAQQQHAGANQVASFSYTPGSPASSDSDGEHKMEPGFGAGHAIPSASNAELSCNASPDTPLFTRRQVHLICERLLKEQENRLREEYEKILSQKLNEQYETFVRFTQDQLHRKCNDFNPSYLS